MLRSSNPKPNRKIFVGMACLLLALLIPVIGPAAALASTSPRAATYGVSVGTTWSYRADINGEIQYHKMQVTALGTTVTGDYTICTSTRTTTASDQAIAYVITMEVVAQYEAQASSNAMITLETRTYGGESKNVIVFDQRQVSNTLLVYDRATGIECERFIDISGNSQNFTIYSWTGALPASCSDQGGTGTTGTTGTGGTDGDAGDVPGMPLWVLGVAMVVPVVILGRSRCRKR